MTETVMSKPDVVAILDFETWFAVRQSKSSDGWDCGEDTPDCAGALHMLCARNITGNAAYDRWWAFEDCLMSNQTVIPANAAGCANKTGVDFKKLSGCVAGSVGQDLLKESARQTTMAKVVWTPWVGIQGKFPDPPPARPKEIVYLKVICDAFAKAGGSPMPASCASNLTTVAA